MFLDHGDPTRPPSLRNLAAVTVDSQWNDGDQAVDGSIRLYADTEAGRVITTLLDQFIADAGAGLPIPDVGLSLSFWPTFTPQPDDDGRHITAIRHVESIDFVFEPAADGRILQALSTLHIEPAGVNIMSTPTPAAVTPEPQPVNLLPLPAAPPQAAGNGATDWLAALAANATSQILATSGLPEPTRARLASQSYATAADLTAAITAARQELAALYAAQVIQIGGTPPRTPHITGGMSGYEQLQLAAEALILGQRPPSGVRPLTGIRELYMLLSGDYELTGVFHGDRVQFATVNSSTMAALTANALNKAVVNMFGQYPQWWKPFTTRVDATSLQAVRWVTLGDVGELPTVAEGASYTELTWDDQTEADPFVKKGGYLGISLEAIDMDDTRRLQAAPRALAQAAWLTLGKSISNIFTTGSGVGPTLDTDSVVLFHTNHSNIGTTALSYTAWNATRIAMRKQTSINAAERLGALTAPKFLLVPPDLEATAIQVLASEGEPGIADNNINPFAEGAGHDALIANARARVIVMDLWTDTNNWAAVADPLLYPSVGVAYRYGDTPEIFSVADPLAGLMFANDTMPIKVRFFYATGPTDYRGLYKQNVA